MTSCNVYTVKKVGDFPTHSHTRDHSYRYTGPSVVFVKFFISCMVSGLVWYCLPPTPHPPPSCRQPDRWEICEGGGICILNTAPPFLAARRGGGGGSAASKGHEGHRSRWGVGGGAGEFNGRTPP